MSKPFYVERGMEISILSTVLGGALLGMVLVDFYHILSFGLGGWEFWVGGLAVILLVVGPFWVLTFISRTRTFERLIVEKSKSIFIKNLDELEYTAWRLPMRYEVRVLERKQFFKIK